MPRVRGECGSLLMEALIERARIRNVHTLISVMGTEVDNLRLSTFLGMDFGKSAC